MPLVDGKVVNWRHTLRIKHLLGEETDIESVRQTAAKIDEVVQAAPFMADWPDLDTAFKPGDIEDVDDLNFALEQLYDYCDHQLIWVE